ARGARRTAFGRPRPRVPPRQPGLTPEALALGRPLVVADHFLDHEADELLAELGIELGVDRQRAQALDLARLASGIARFEPGLRLVLADRLGDAESLGEHVDQRGIDVVDALAVGRQDRVLALRLRFAGHVRGTLARNCRLPIRPWVANCAA